MKQIATSIKKWLFAPEQPESLNKQLGVSDLIEYDNEKDYRMHIQAWGASAAFKTTYPSGQVKWNVRRA